VIYTSKSIWNTVNKDNVVIDNRSLAVWLFCSNTLHHFKLQIIQISFALNLGNKVKREQIDHIQH